MATTEVHAVVFEDACTGRWVGMCLEYDVVTQAADGAAALAAVTEAVGLFLSEREPGEGDTGYQPIRGEPRIARLSVHAPALLQP